LVKWGPAKAGRPVYEKSGLKVFDAVEIYCNTWPELGFPGSHVRKGCEECRVGKKDGGK
jgi:hypothetical protein